MSRRAIHWHEPTLHSANSSPFSNVQSSAVSPRQEARVDTFEYPNELLRRKLLMAGIPEQEHDVLSLAAKMPADIDILSYQGLSADMTAELLLYFIAKGLIKLPVAGERALLDMPWGTHVCQFYKDKEDLLEMLVPYFRQGLARSEACFWLVGDLTVEEAKSALSAVVPDLERHVAKGQLIVRHYSEFYTNSNGTVKSSDQMCCEFAEMGIMARARGYAGLRTSGNVSWINNEESMSRFMDYETKVNYAIQHSRIMSVCTYPSRAAAMCRCRELIHNHGKFFVKHGKWVHDMSKDAERVESVFAALATL